MKLALIVAATPTKQQLVDYQNSCAVVNQYAYAITNTSMPVLNQPPANYGDFVTEFAPAKAHCIEWSNGIFPTMLSFPVTIVDQAADLFRMEDSMASAYLDMLIADPNNAGAKTGLGKALTTMQNVVGTQLTTAQDLLKSMNTFTTDITVDAVTLNQLAQQALDDAGADQQGIINLNADIDSLHDQINTLNTLLTLSEIGMGVSIFVGLIGAVCCVIPGAQGVGVGLIVIGVAGEAASITGTVLLNQEIDAKNQAIQQDQLQISQLNQDVIALQATNQQFVWLERANIATQQAIKAVIQMWQDLDDELATVITDLATVGTAATSAQYQAAQDDLTAAAAAWDEVNAFAHALAGVVYNWQDKDGNWHSYTAKQPSNDGSEIAMLPSNAPVAA